MADMVLQIFQSYYQTTILQDSSPSNMCVLLFLRHSFMFDDKEIYRAWIGSIQYALVFFPAILIGRLFDLGYFRSVFLTSSALLVAATFLVAECHVYWQFLLCQGLAVGVGVSCSLLSNSLTLIV